MAKGNCAFKGSGGEYFGTVFLHLYVLGVFTFGIYSAWAWVRLLKLKASHTLINGKKVTFEGTGGQLFGIVIVQGLLTLVTFGLYGPWALCKYLEWRARNTVIEGEPGRFNGSGGSLFLFSLIHLFLLPLITVGLYYFWGVYRFYAWKEEHTRYGGKKTSFGAGFGTFLKILIITSIVNTVTFNLFAPWAYCMFSRWQLEGLAVGDEAKVEHFPPVKTNIVVVIILAVVGICFLAAIAFLIKGAMERSIRRQHFARLKQLQAQVIEKKRQAKPPKKAPKPHTLKQKSEKGALTPLEPKHTRLTSDVMEKLQTGLKRYDDAVEKAEARIRKDPSDPNARYDRAWLYGTHGELEKAIVAYTKAIHLNKKFEDAYYNRGLLYFAAERYREAIKDFNAAVEMNPQAVDSLCNRGISYFALGNKNMALADFDHALTISPDDGDVLYNRAIVRMVMGDRVGAEKDLRKALANRQPLAAAKLQELQNATSETATGWRMDLKGVSIPAAPAAGRIHGDSVTIDQAFLENGILTLRDGRDFFPDHAFVIFLFLKKGENLENRRFEYTKISGFGSPHIHVKWKEKGKDLPKTKIWMKGYAMLLEFGRQRGKELPGKIYLCIPDDMKSFLAGTFTALIKK